MVALNLSASQIVYLVQESDEADRGRKKNVEMESLIYGIYCDRRDQEKRAVDRVVTSRYPTCAQCMGGAITCYALMSHFLPDPCCRLQLATTEVVSSLMKRDPRSREWLVQAASDPEAKV